MMWAFGEGCVCVLRNVCVFFSGSLQCTFGGHRQLVSVGLTVSHGSESTGQRLDIHFNEDGGYHFPAGFPREEAFQAIRSGAEMAAMRGRHSFFEGASFP